MAPLPQAPLAYTIRLSPRARRPRLVMSLAGGLTVVLPVAGNPARQERLAAELVRQNAAWIERTAARLRSRRPEQPEARPLPAWLELMAVGRVLALECAPRPGVRPRLRQNGPDRLLLAGDLDDQPAVRAALLDWLKARARQELLPMLEEVSAAIGLPFAAASFRAQARRWGSCSRAGNISLNCRLLLLPEHLARAVMIHELCHTAHPDHSARFYALAARHDPQARELRHRLADAEGLIPALLR